MPPETDDGVSENSDRVGGKTFRFAVTDFVLRVAVITAAAIVFTLFVST